MSWVHIIRQSETPLLLVVNSNLTPLIENYTSVRSLDLVLIWSSKGVRSRVVWISIGFVCWLENLIRVFQRLDFVIFQKKKKKLYVIERHDSFELTYWKWGNKSGFSSLFCTMKFTPFWMDAQTFWFLKCFLAFKLKIWLHLVGCDWHTYRNFV